jgi:DNA ligase (NAD+)
VKTARDLAERFGTLEAIRSADETALGRVPGIGPTVARAVAGFFREATNRRVVDQCLARGLELITHEPGRRGPLTGKVLVFTGALKTMTRDEAESRARTAGARAGRTVGRDTDLVVAGSDPGSKYRKARALGIRVIGERQFRQLVGQP